MKKQISPVLTVIVILVVVAVVALLWTHFGNPGKEKRAGGGGFGINTGPGGVDFSKVNSADLQKAREAAAAAKEKMLEQRRSGRAPGS